MATQVTNSFVRQYEREVHHLFQRAGGYLRPTVRTKNNVTGSSTTFQKIGKGAASTKARHGVVPAMNQSHDPIECVLEDFYAGDWVDKLDEAKVNHDERLAIAQGGAWALGRKVDDQIITNLDTTTETAVTWTLTSPATVRNALIGMLEALDANDVPNDGGRYVLLTPRAWAFALLVEEFASADYVGPDGLPFREGASGFNQWRRWMGALWTMHTGLPGRGTAATKVFAYHRNAVGHAVGMDVTADITWHGDRASHFVNHMMGGGACLIDTTGVIEGAIDDTQALPTS